MASYTEKDTHTGDNSTTFNIYSSNWYAQTWTAGSSYECGRIAVKVLRSGSPGTCTASLRATSADLPTGADLASGTFDGDSITTDASGEWVNVTFSTPVSIVSGTAYAIVLRAVSGDASNKIAWRCSTGNAYANGRQCSSGNSGGTWTGNATGLDNVFKTYEATYTPSEKDVTKFLVFFSGDTVYHGSDLDSIAEFTDAAGDINTVDRLSAFEAEQKAFIANKTNLKVYDRINAKITTANVGANPPDRGNLLTDGTSGAKMIVDYVTALSGACTIYGYKTVSDAFGSGNTVTGTDNDGNAISFVLNAAEDAAPHWYDWGQYGAATSNMPDSSSVSAFWRGRAVLRDDLNKTQFVMSRVGNLYDFDVDTPGAEDALRPVYGALGDTGKPGDVISAIIPFNDNYMLFACTGAIYVLVGDPASGGQVGEIKGVGGIIDARAWTWDDKGNLWILTHYGLMRVPKGFGSFENLTEQTYPEFISDVAFNPSTDRIVLQYDVAEHGVVITKTNVSDNTNTNWFYDPNVGGLFKDTFQTAHAVYSAAYFHADDPTERLTVYGCSDGYLRYFDTTAKSDDGSNAIDSYIDYGPIQLADSPDFEGKIFKVDAEIGDGDTSSDDVACRIWVERSADDVVKSLTDNTTPDAGGTFSSGRRRGGAIRREVKGVYAGIKLRNNTAGESWSFEKLLVGVRPAGRVK